MPRRPNVVVSFRQGQSNCNVVVRLQPETAAATQQQLDTEVTEDPLSAEEALQPLRWLTNARLRQNEVGQVSGRPAWLVGGTGYSDAYGGVRMHMVLLAMIAPRPGRSVILTCGAGGASVPAAEAAWVAIRSTVMRIAALLVID